MGVAAGVPELVCWSARVPPAGKRRSLVWMRNGTLFASGAASHAAYAPDESAMPPMNEDSWPHCA